MKKEKPKTCCICGEKFYGWGNNPYPVVKTNDENVVCCNECNSLYVIPARIMELYSQKEENV
jgi:hypothetical protein